ncbi:MAG: hypothetical protein IKH12_04005 [Clostridia bacterium]|nr:hypothetical protein [Clostridia bacterium]
MSFGAMRAILVFMIFIMRYISKFLPKGEEEPEEEEKKAPEWQLFGRDFPLL